MVVLRTIGIGLLAALVAGGCARWHDSAGEPSTLPPPRMSADSVSLEIGFVRVRGDDEEITSGMWRRIDEQHLPVSLRRRLAANGIRCGLVGSQMPAALGRLLRTDRKKSPGLEGEGVRIDGQEQMVVRRQLQSRAGHRGEIIASSTCDEMVVLTSDSGQIRGQTFEQAQCLWAVKTFPLGDGRVRIKLTPEVQHGQRQRRWEGHDGTFRLNTGRPQEVFEQLQIEAVLSPGQTLLLAPTAEPKGLGRQFFAESDDDRICKLLLVRLAQTQYDDLFAPERIVTPINDSRE